MLENSITKCDCLSFSTPQGKVGYFGADAFMERMKTEEASEYEIPIRNISYRGYTKETFPRLGPVKTKGGLYQFCQRFEIYSDEDLKRIAAKDLKQDPVPGKPDSVCNNGKLTFAVPWGWISQTALQLVLEWRGMDHVTVAYPTEEEIHTAASMAIYAREMDDSLCALIKKAVASNVPVMVSQFDSQVTLDEAAGLLCHKFYPDSPTAHIRKMLDAYCFEKDVSMGEDAIRFDAYLTILEKHIKGELLFKGISFEEILKKAMESEPARQFIGDFEGKESRELFVRHFLEQELGRISETAGRTLYTAGDGPDIIRAWEDYCRERGEIITVGIDGGLWVNSLDECSVVNAAALTIPWKQILPDIQDILLDLSGTGHRAGIMEDYLKEIIHSLRDAVYYHTRP